MDDETRGRLLLAQERAQATVTNLRAALQNDAQALMKLAQSIQNKPENVVFANAPDNLGSYGISQMHVPSIAWENIPTKEGVAQKIQDLRAAIKQLETVQSQLSARY